MTHSDSRFPSVPTTSGALAIPPAGPHVYFIEAENGLLKIGYSANIALRFRALLTASATPLKLRGWLPGNTKLERDLHDRLAASRSHGEWFNPTAEVRAVLETIERPATVTTKTAGKRGAALMAYLERMKRGEVVRPTRDRRKEVAAAEAAAPSRSLARTNPDPENARSPVHHLQASKFAVPCRVAYRA